MWQSVILLLALAASALSQGMPGVLPPDEKVNYTFNNQYMALMPKVMRPGQMFDVSITHIDPPRDGQPVTVNVGLRTMGKESKLLIEKDDSIPAVNCIGAGPCPVTKVISFKAPDQLDDSSYNVTVSGSSGSVNFYNSTEVKVSRKVSSLFIQTDRAMYKPSQTVRFRVLSVDPDLKPLELPLNITIHDSSQNRLKQWLNVKSTTGVITRNFSLSDQPPLGEWYINVVGEHVAERKTFEVAEYVLPKFEVTLDLPSFMLLSMEKITVTAAAKYTYGQPVKGQCSLYVAVDQFLYMSQQTLKSMNITQKLENGKIDFQIKMSQLEELLPPPYSNYDKRTARERMLYKQWLFSAACKEDLTGKVLVKNGTSRVEANKFKLSFMSNTPDNFKPGLVFNAFVKLTLVDNTAPAVKDLTYPGNGSRIPIKLFSSPRVGVRPPDAEEEKPMAVAYPNDEGIAVFKIKAADNIDSISMTVVFNDGTYEASAYRYVRKFKTRDGGALQIRMINEGNLVKSGQEAQFNISTATRSSIINIQILAKGELVRSEAAVYAMSNSHLYKFLVDNTLAQELAPKARIVAWYMTDKKEIISDSVDFKVDGAFQNNVTLQFSTSKTKPGTDVKLTVSAEANSFVALLAVDQSSLLLASGNDITQDMVTEELEKYDSINDMDDGIYPVPFFRREKRAIWCPWCYFSTGGKDSNEVFMNSGMIYLTDIYLYVEPRPSYYYPFERGVRGPLLGARGPAAPPPVAPDAQAPAAPTDEMAAPGAPAANRAGLMQVSRVRTKFPETWLWTETMAGADGKAYINTKTPDTITSWVASAFAMHHEKGLGITEHTSEITVFKPFFVSMDLPYSVIRGEELELKIIIFNYQSTPLSVALKLKKSLEFAVEEPNGIEFTHADVETTVKVESNDGKTISLWIKPVVLGNMAIEVEARSVLAADAVRRMLLVEPEGAPQGYDLNFLVEISDDDELFEKRETLSLPTEEEGLVRDSVRIDVSAIGDIMGPAMNNLNNLVKMPYGCGEQNMLNFAPNIFVMNYLKATGRNEPDLEAKAVEFMERGYQRELTYQRSDGSFSAFGNSDKSGSTWLTAFVVKSFYQAQKYIDVDMFNVARSVNWILEQQMPSGQFNEPGRVIHTDMQGGSASDVTMTAYITVALLEMKGMEEIDKERVSNAVSQAISYLKKQMKNKLVYEDPYTMAILTYAMALNEDPTLDKTFEKLASMAISQDGMTHWDKMMVQPFQPRMDGDVVIWQPPQRQAKTSAIESTAYAMLSYISINKVADAVPIMRWLVSQRNSLGGYGSTQDTVMALQALAEFGMKSSGGGEVSLNIEVETSAGLFTFPQITPTNDMVLQKQQIGMSGFEDIVTVRARGRGMALIQVAVSYNLLKTSETQDIDLEVVSKLQDDGSVDVDICAIYMPKEPSGMVVLEASMLSGYEPTNIEDLKQKVDALRRVDQKDKTLYLYLDELVTGQLTCMNVMATQVNKVSKLQKAKVKAYPYYAPHQTKTSFYLPRDLADVSSCADGSCRSPNGVLFEYSNRQDIPQKIETIYKGHKLPKIQAVAAGSTCGHMTALSLITVAVISYFL